MGQVPSTEPEGRAYAAHGDHCRDVSGPRTARTARLEHLPLPEQRRPAW
jgi:hypothetical protein